MESTQESSPQPASDAESASIAGSFTGDALAPRGAGYGPVQRIHLGSGDGAPPSFNLMRHIKAVLRGRYPIVIGLGLLTGILGAVGGWKMGHPMFSSSGLVRIAYELPQIMKETDQNGPMEMFDTYMQSQRLLITSRSVLDKAVEDPIWHATGHDVPDDAEGYFRDHLIVNINPRSEYIQIMVTDRDGGMAMAAVTAIINAYQAMYERQTSQLEDTRMGALREKQAPLDQTIQDLNSQINQYASEYGTTDLSTFYAAAVDRVGRTEAALEDIRNAIAIAPPDPTAATGGADTQPANSMSVTQIAAVDTHIRDLLDQESRLEDGLKRTRRKYGPNSDIVQNALLNIADAKDAINKYADAFRRYNSITGQNPNDPTRTSVNTTGRSLASLKESERQLNQVYTTEYGEMVALGKKQMAVEQLRQSSAEVQEKRDQVVDRTNTLQSEDALGGRLSITSSPEIPLGPDKDPRLKNAAAGAVAGAAFPAMALILGSLLFKGRLRYSTDTEHELTAGIPLLGIVPTVKLNGEGGEEDINAAHCIHQIRVSLRAQAPHDRHCSLYLVTSAAAGEGKTNLTMALGLSFAASRVRTLLIDCDLVSRQLSNTLDARDYPGVFEAIAAGTIRKRLRKAARNLYLLPAGQVGINDYFSVSAAKLRPLLAEARRHFDVVLIDTGPILGSVEAAVLAREVDGVLFTVSRNQRRAVVERAIHRLNTLDARLEGMIFNRARAEDFETSLYSTSSTRSIRSMPSTNGKSHRPNVQQAGAFGPLVQAVASTLPDGPSRADVEAGSPQL